MPYRKNASLLTAVPYAVDRGSVFCSECGTNRARHGDYCLPECGSKAWTFSETVEEIEVGLVGTVVSEFDPHYGWSTFVDDFAVEVDGRPFLLTEAELAQAEAFLVQASI